MQTLTSKPSQNEKHCRDFACVVEAAKYSIEIDGLLAGSRGLQAGRQACYFSALHLFEHTQRTRRPQ